MRIKFVVQEVEDCSNKKGGKAMVVSSEIKKLAVSLGADQCGIASIDRFSQSPSGFHPTDIYIKCKSVVAFIKKMPSAVIRADNPVPYTHSVHLMHSAIDRIGLELCRSLERKGIGAVPVPCDTPYEYWDAERSHGMGILSMRHTGYLAGLGVLGKNTLLVNKDLGNLISIGAILVDAELEPDSIITDQICMDNCRKCLDACPQGAIDGTAVNQALCRSNSLGKTARGFDVYVCNACRRVCPRCI